jgi:hypothetical protein
MVLLDVGIGDGDIARDSISLEQSFMSTCDDVLWLKLIFY